MTHSRDDGIDELNGLIRARSSGVSEWVEDCSNESYRGGPADGSAWLSENCGERVFRGGGWIYAPRFVRSAGRFTGTAPVLRNNNLGFRVARTLP